ncbi:complex I NDUFA9 subunit family protein [Tropicimonas sp.]|uniref:complex I NDUFA9 subunit family protein n=1 Tax=Tropicimonas sp. TaxID=2067044 RepID=UPI003A8B5F88
MSRIVTIFGGSGFVGRYVARRLAKDGWRVRVATRDPNEAGVVRTYGEVGQVEPVACNIRDDASVAAAMDSADAVVNCVGILAEHRKNTFEAIHVDGAGRIARLAARAGIPSLVHVSAIGADPASDSDYLRTKGLGEAVVLAEMPDAVILRPSIIFGPEDSFFNRFARQSRFGPVLTVVGAETKFQPVYVDDIAQAASVALAGRAAPGIYELGGPDVRTFRELMEQMLRIIRRRRLIHNMSFGMARFIAGAFGVVQTVSFGLVRAPLTADQVRSLAHDNVVGKGARGFGELGVDPMATGAVLPEYLWKFRPHGQYEAITESARDLRV